MSAGSVAIQSTSVTRGSTPITMVGMLDLTSGRLKVIGPAAGGVLHSRVRADFSFITDLWRSEDFDSLFSQELFAPAVQEVRAMAAQALLELEPKAVLFNPHTKIEFDGYDANGKPLIRIDSDCGNGHFAILAMVWQAGQLLRNEHLIDSSDDLMRFSVDSTLRQTQRGRQGMPAALERELAGVPLLRGSIY